MTVYVRDKVLSALATGPKTRRQIGSVVLSHERNIERVMGKLQTVGYVSIVGKTENGANIYALNNGQEAGKYDDPMEAFMDEEKNVVRN